MKAILVIDMPNECIKCPLFAFGCCQANRHIVSFETITFGEKSNYCPLRPLPERKDVEKIRNLHGNGQGNCAIGCAIGYNACLDEIIGETE